MCPGLGRPVPRKPEFPDWTQGPEPKPKQKPPGADGPAVPETEEEKALPRPERSAKARRKREPRTSMHADYLEEGPAGDKKCGALKQEGTRCSQAAGWGTDHVGYGPCKHHMGATPAGRKAAGYEMGEELMAFYGSPIDTSPIEALLDEVNRTAGHVAWLGKRISQFDIPLTEEVDDATGKVKVIRPAGLPPEVDGWIRVYQSERTQLIKASKMALDAGVNERLVQIAEHQGAKLADAVETILVGLRLTVEQQAMVPTIVPRVLRQLTSGAPMILEGETDGD